MSDTNQQQGPASAADRIARALEDAFESVALTRRAHFERNPRPTRSDVDGIIRSYANQNALVAGGANLVPGPWGALAIVPELTLILRNQIQMIYDLGVAHGKEAHLDSRFLLAVFATVVGGGAVGLLTVKGSQVLVKRASLRVLQRIIAWLGGRITQRVLRQFIAKWLPVVGAAAMAVWARQQTVGMGRKTAEIMALDVVYVDGDPESPPQS